MALWAKWNKMSKGFGPPLFILDVVDVLCCSSTSVGLTLVVGKTHHGCTFRLPNRALEIVVVARVKGRIWINKVLATILLVSKFISFNF